MPFHKPIYAFRATKEDWELELMRKAQAITDRAFAEVITRIKPGMTELELQAELIYCMYKNGGTGLAFDPIVYPAPIPACPTASPVSASFRRATSSPWTLARPTWATAPT